MERIKRMTGLMRKGLLTLALAVFAITAMPAYAQSSIKVEAPNIVGAEEQFNVTFMKARTGLRISFGTRVRISTWSGGLSRALPPVFRL